MTTSASLSTVRAAVYARISSDRRGDEAGVSRQIEEAKCAVGARGWALAGIHTDNALSALRGLARPGYQRLMADVVAGQVDVVVVYQTSRLWRNRRERADGIDTLRAHS